MFPSRLSFTSSFLFLAALACFAGCDSKTPGSAQQPSASDTAAPRVSEVPLRVWIASEVADAEVIQRQWLAGSDQPIQIKSLTVDDMLTQKELECDVLLFPAKELGEVVYRDWILKLPSELNGDRAIDSMADEEQDSVQLPQSWMSQCEYDGEVFAVPLGMSVPAVVANDALAKLIGDALGESDVVSWADVLSLLEKSSEPTTLEKGLQDAQAVADRFLTIAYSLSTRNPRYGMLFETKSMTPQLNAPEFRSAAEILQSLVRQPKGIVNLASHDAAWAGIASSTSPLLCIASATDLREETLKSSAGRIVPISSAFYANTGSGLLAAISANCRQSAQSIELLRWLTRPTSRNSIAPKVMGIDSTTPLGTTDSLSWSALQRQQTIGSEQIVQEPRMMQADEYRLVLGEELIAYLVDDQTLEEAFASATRRWNEITAADSKRLTLDYQRSLGLLK